MSVNVEKLLTIMSMLRDESHGCPWDRKQTFQTIAPHTLEEVYEVVDTIEREDYAHLANELGDLLFQVVFYAQLGKEAGYFDFQNVVDEITTKLLQRHPHVFPEATVESFGTRPALTASQVEGNWEELKKQERQDKHGKTVSVLDDVPATLPALTRAGKLQKRAATVGFDWPDIQGVIEKCREEVEEIQEAVDSRVHEDIEGEVGDMFFTLVNLSRHLGIDPETSLRKANSKFENRFRHVEAAAKADNADLQSASLEKLESYWQQAKKTST